MEVVEEAIIDNDILEVINEIEIEVVKVNIPPLPLAPLAPPAPPAPISTAAKYKKKWYCYKCGLNLASKEKLTKHMTSRNCKRKLDIDEPPEPHETTGTNFKLCIDQYKSSKEKNHNEERIL